MSDMDIEILEINSVPYSYEYKVNYKGTVVTVNVGKRKASKLNDRELAAHLLPMIRGAVMEVRLSRIHQAALNKKGK